MAEIEKEINKIDDELIPSFDKKYFESQDYKTAINWERIGFKKLVHRDLDEAISAFNNSEKSFNTFHQVYQIGRYLRGLINWNKTINFGKKFI